MSVQTRPRLVWSGSLDIHTRDARIVHGLWDVRGFTRLKVRSRVVSGFWTAAQVQVLGTVDKLDFKLLQTIFGVGGPHVHPIDRRVSNPVGELIRINVSKFEFVDFRCAVIEPAPAIVGFSGVADSQV